MIHRVLHYHIDCGFCLWQPAAPLLLLWGMLAMALQRFGLGSCCGCGAEYGCGCCADNAGPETFTVELDGINDDSCTDCDQMNAVWELSGCAATSETACGNSDECSWGAEISSGVGVWPCGSAGGSFACVDGGGPFETSIFVLFKKFQWQVLLRYRSSFTNVAVFYNGTGSSPHSCSSINTTLNYSSGEHSSCDVSGSTAEVIAQ